MNYLTNRQKNRIGRCAALLAVIISALLLLSFAAAAEDGTEKIPLSRSKAYLISTVENGKILKSANTEERISPASTVKIMSGLLLCEAFSERLDEKITVTSAQIKDVSGRYAGLAAGQTPTVRDLLYMGFCGGFNDAIRILATVQYGSDEGLISAMNMRAAFLGMKSTFYVNSTGVHNDNMFTTVSDLQKLALAAYSCNLYMTVSSATAYSTEGLYSPFSFENYNKIISSGQYRNTLCRGINAGSTPEDGYSLVTIAEKNGVPYLCIVMGAESDSEGIYSYIIANQLLTWAINRYGTVSLLSQSDVICELEVRLSVKTKSLTAVPAEDVSAFLPLTYTVGKEITRTYELDSEKLDAPVSDGQKVGTVTVYCEGTEFATVDLVVRGSAEKSELLEGLQKIMDFSKSDFFKGILISAAILIIVFITVRAFVIGTRNKNRRRSRASRSR